MDRVSRLAHADRAMVLLADQPAGPLVARSARGFRRDDLERVVVEPGQGMIGRAFLAGRVVTGRSGEPDPFVERFPVRHAVAVPVRIEDGVAGVLFAGRRGDTAFGPTDVLVLAAIAERVGAALGLARLRDQRRLAFDRLRSLGARRSATATSAATSATCSPARARSPPRCSASRWPWSRWPPTARR